MQTPVSRGPDVDVMSEPDLVAALAADLRPVPHYGVARRLLFALGLGVAVSTLLVVTGLGLRPDMPQAMGGSMFWIKAAYAAALCGVALWACERLARPGASAGGRILWLAPPLLAVAALAGWELSAAPASERHAMLMGGSARVCPWMILAASLPPLAALVWAVRGMAPTRLRLAGLMIGLAAGGAGAAAYALHCTESAAPFLAVWYTLGVAGAGLLGALAGPRLLRW